MKNYIVLILIFSTIALCSCQHNSKNINQGNAFADSTDGFNGDTLNIEISESNKKFSINDSTAIELIRQVPELRQIIDYKYEDTTIFNQLYIENLPSETDNNWQFKIVQFQPKTGKVAGLVQLLVNANNGSISIWDNPKDTIVLLDTWLKTIVRK